MNFQVVPVVAILSVFVFCPLTIGFLVYLFKKPAKPPKEYLENSERLRRLETAVESIAVEVERISEGQRFVTKLLADQTKARLPQGSE